MPATPGDLGLDTSQLGYARTIYARGKAAGASGADIGIALMVALTESSLRNYANTNVPESLAIPHDAVGSDGRSVGLFQQQVGIWGTAAQLMDPATSADKFYAALRKTPHASAAHPWITAQQVQKSAFPDGSNYQKNYVQATNILQNLGGFTVQDPLPGQPGFNGEIPGFGQLPGTGTVPSWSDGLAKIGTLFSDPVFWRRVGLFTLGGALVALVLWKIVDAGTGGALTKTAGTAAKAAVLL